MHIIDMMLTFLDYIGSFCGFEVSGSATAFVRYVCLQHIFIHMRQSVDFLCRDGDEIHISVGILQLKLKHTLFL